MLSSSLYDCSIKGTTNNLFEDFIRSCAFIHDDYEPNEIDHYGSNPFLIGANVCVVDTLKGFGTPYINYLKRLNIFPRVVIEPTRNFPSLLDDLLNDDEALLNFGKEVIKNKLDISSFYSDKDFERLISKISLNGDFIPKVYPPKELFCFVNDKVRMRQLLMANGMPIPEGEVCSNFQELCNYQRHYKGQNIKLFLKIGHRNGIIINSDDDIKKDLKNIEFPLIAELFYDVKNSPVSNCILWKNQSHHLFTIDQIIEELKHAGNRAPSLCSDDQLKEILYYSNKIINLVNDFEGIIGIDYIVTNKNEIFVVDINGRFNSCTYPFFFLKKMECNFNVFFASYRYINAQVEDLSELYEDENFISFDKDSLTGILLFNPVFDFKNCKVIKLSYLCVEKKKEEVQKLERVIKEIVNRHSMVL